MGRTVRRADLSNSLCDCDNPAAHEHTGAVSHLAQRSTPESLDTRQTMARRFRARAR